MHLASPDFGSADFASADLGNLGKETELRAKAVAVLLVIATAAFGQTAEQRLPVCLACHGASGASQQDGVPSLGAMPSDYVLTQLYLFREKQRMAAPMNAMAAGLSDDDLRTLGETITQLPAPPPAGEPLTAGENDHGLALVTQYHCNSCHGSDLSGHDSIPRLAEQREEYLVQALTAYKNNSRPGYSPAMSEASQEIKLDDIPVLAKYISHYR